jgi:hypothetical protein
VRHRPGPPTALGWWRELTSSKTVAEHAARHRLARVIGIAFMSAHIRLASTCTGLTSVCTGLTSAARCAQIFYPAFATWCIKQNRRKMAK